MSGRKVLKIVIDFVCFLIVVGYGLYFYFNNRPTMRGFYCNDQSIRYPKLPSIISDLNVLLIGLLLPVILILIVEIIDFCYLKTMKEAPPSKVIMNRLRIHHIVWYSYSRIGVYLFGFFMNGFVTSIGKKTIGMLRPHFISVCDPELPDPCNNEYIVNISCRGKDKRAIYSGRHSFPSGHASTSFYCMVYLVIYLQVRFGWTGSTLLKPFIQFGLLSAAVYISLTRIADYHHHWYDTIGGIILGSTSAILAAIFISDLVRPYKKGDSSEDLRSTNFPLSSRPNISRNVPSADRSQELRRNQLFLDESKSNKPPLSSTTKSSVSPPSPTN